MQIVAVEVVLVVVEIGEFVVVHASVVRSAAMTPSPAAPLAQPQEVGGVVLAVPFVQQGRLRQREGLPTVRMHEAALPLRLAQAFQQCGPALVQAVQQLSG